MLERGYKEKKHMDREMGGVDRRGFRGKWSVEGDTTMKGRFC
jgi:hypothetical protein